MASRRKRCMVRVVQTKTLTTRKGEVFTCTEMVRCDAKIKPGTPFCKEHFETHKLVEVQCNGEAHSNAFIDHCGVCMPFWGKYPYAVTKDEPGKPWERERWE